MSRTYSFLLVSAAVLGLAAADEEVVFRSDVNMLRVDAQVVDRDNRAITGLRVNDFVLRESGKVVEIRNFASENMPIDLLLLLDVSGSMRPHVQRVSSAAHQALQAFGKEDRVGIMVFDRSTRVRLPFTANKSDVEREMDALLRHETFNGGTDITRGLVDAAEYVGRSGRRDARRAIVILTDDETEFERDDERVSRALTRADAVLSALIAPDAMRNRGIGGRQGSPRNGGSWPGSGGGIGGGPLGGIIIPGGGGRQRRGPGGNGPNGPVQIGSRTKSAGTSEIARASGGDSMPVDDAGALETTLARLRQRYSLYFYLPEGVNPGEERGIEVSLASTTSGRYPDAEVRYRRVYLAPNGKVTADPVSVTRAPVYREPASRSASRSTDESEVVRRRPRGDMSTGPRNGPLDVGQNDPPPAPEAKPAAPPPAATPDSDTGGGWRVLKPGEKP